MTSIAAENYHLKWDSHVNYLNGSVATLFKNEKYADVILLSSNPDGGFGGIPAHRFVLSSFSHFFATIFDTNPTTPNSTMYVVLPSELSKKSIQILVQYMYCGEATVSNDILNEVLRGGELLKIRGLCRSISGGNINSHSIDQQSQSAHYSLHQSKNSETSQKVSNDLRNMGNSSDVLKMSPVIVMSPQPHLPHQSQPSLPMNTTAQSICLRKDVAIDPDETRMQQSSHFSSLQIAAAVKKAQHGNDGILKTIDIDRCRRHSEDISNPKDLSRDENTIPRSHTKDEEQISRVDHRRTSLPETVNTTTTEKSKHQEHGSLCTVERHSEAEIPEALNFLTIKQEPTDWPGDQDETTVLKPPLDIIKTENAYGDDDSDQEDDDMVYSPLTCELCKETFTVPGDWVRHIDTHMDTTTAQCVPKKRKRMPGGSSEYIASLKCDLCSTYFVTPGEWVRHIQNTHTETELAISNNSALPKKKNKPSGHHYALLLDKTCDVCGKKFLSYASMVIHKRNTHTESTEKNSTTNRIFFDTCYQCNGE